MILWKRLTFFGHPVGDTGYNGWTNGTFRTETATVRRHAVSWRRGGEEKLLRQVIYLPLSGKLAHGVGIHQSPAVALLPEILCIDSLYLLWTEAVYAPRTDAAYSEYSNNNIASHMHADIHPQVVNSGGGDVYGACAFIPLWLIFIRPMVDRCWIYRVAQKVSHYQVLSLKHIKSRQWG